MSDVLLSVHDLHAAYGPIRALRGVSFDIRAGETVAVIGANGAGKTSLMRAVSSLLAISQGQASFFGKDISRCPPHQLARMGMLHVLEGRGTLQSMPVLENLRLAWEIRPSDVPFEEAIAAAYARFPRLKERSQQLAGNLSGGEQQMLAVARAIVNRPKLLLLDEPSMGLSPLFTSEVFRVLRELRDAGVSILLVEQNVSRALELAHRAMVLSHGEFILEGTASELANDPRVLTSYMGYAPAPRRKRTNSLIHDTKSDMHIEWAGKNAIVTGAASGIGAAMAERLAHLKMNVVMADIRAEPLMAVGLRLQEAGLSVSTIPIDVSDPSAVAQLADHAEQLFGDIHLAFNNAGVAMHGTPMHEMSLDDWQWVIDVNIRSIAYSIHHILPRMLRHGQPGYFINTASIGGLQVNPDWLTGAYSMTKYAVVAMTEGLANEHRDGPIRMAVLCPAAVATGLGTGDSRPDRLGGPTERPSQAFLAEAIRARGLDPDIVARRVLRAMDDGDFFVFTDSIARPVIEDRHRRIQQSFDRTEAFLRSIES